MYMYINIVLVITEILLRLVKHLSCLRHGLQATETQSKLRGTLIKLLISIVFTGYIATIHTYIALATTVGLYEGCGLCKISSKVICWHLHIHATVQYEMVMTALFSPQP